MTTALITGASRGVGAATAILLAGHGVDVVINYHNKAARAEAVATQIRQAGGRALPVRADLTDAVATRAMLDAAVDAYGSLDLLILNASGGLEQDMPADYAMRLNRDAQVFLALSAIEHMPRGSRIVFVTSHEAHFYGSGETFGGYAPVAASKQAGERVLQANTDRFAAAGISLTVVSGDLIDGTITAKLLDRAHPGLIEERRDQAGYLPTIDDFAAAVADAALASDPAKIIFVGELPAGHRHP